MSSKSLTIVNRIVQGARSKLSLTPQQCYPIIQRHYIEGFGQRALQVVPGPVRPIGGGDGLQDGGAIQRNFQYTLWAWYRFKGDPRQMSIDMITQDTNGFMDYIEAVRSTFEYTLLGNNTLGDATSGTVILGAMRYVGEAETFWQDNAKGVAYRGITFACNSAERWQTQLTLDDSNFTS